MKCLVGIASIICALASCEAKSDLTLIDTAGNHLGRFVNFFDIGAKGYLRYETFDGYIVTLESPANILPASSNTAFFLSNDCTGQAYVHVFEPDRPGYFFPNGIGQIISLGHIQNGGAWYGMAA